MEERDSREDLQGTRVEADLTGWRANTSGCGSAASCSVGIDEDSTSLRPAHVLFRLADTTGHEHAIADTVPRRARTYSEIGVELRRPRGNC